MTRVAFNSMPSRWTPLPGGMSSSGVREDLTEALRAMLIQALSPAPTLPGVTQVQRASVTPPQ
ncbi:hypothetical protein D7Y23_28030 [Corallococcus sp. AB050B]|nr:hypothetical protein D7Y23_28030 [Corallococcus sp. AB050B]